ncbi:NAD(P) transhydrogenase subunit alpha [Owenweeksia hongkongensis]|uniref:NAD(P) transhydrogenase subunit alpha n=1 Tax=Owenweeksia hongkongensis TaxID=253245 RepID=UPI003A8CE9FD
MQSLGIFKEPANESRVSVIPDTVKRITQTLNMEVWVEEGAGIRAGFTNKAYEEAGAKIVSNSNIFKNSEGLLSINHLYRGEEVEDGKSFIGIYNLMYHRQRISTYQKSNLSVFSLDMVPRTTKAQSMDVLSSMASLSGYKAVIKSAELYGSVLPMFTTAAGTLKPAKVLILGAGVAGLQAIATAKRLGAIVEAFDVRRAAGEEVRSLGAKFIEVPGYTENTSAGGYAVEQSPEYLKKQKELIHEHISNASIVISTANIPGRKAPLLIEQASVECMQPGSVIVDLASEQGGNCALTQDERMIEHNGVKIIGSSYLAKEMPMASSQMLSANYFSFIKHLKQQNGNAANDPILQGCKVIENGELIHPAFIKNLTSA